MAITKAATCRTPNFFRASTHVPSFQKPTSAHSSQVNVGSETLTMLPPPDAVEDNPAKAGAKAEGSFPSSGRHDLEPPAFFQPGKVDSQEHMSPRDRIFPPPRDIHFGSAGGYADPHVSQPRTDRISPFDSATSFKAGLNKCPASHEHCLASPTIFSGASEAKFRSILFSSSFISII